MSFKSKEADYNARRAAEHTARACWAQTSKTRAIHEELARAYSVLAEQQKPHTISIENPDRATGPTMAGALDTAPIIASSVSSLGNAS